MEPIGETNLRDVSLYRLTFFTLKTRVYRVADTNFACSPILSIEFGPNLMVSATALHKPSFCSCVCPTRSRHWFTVCAQKAEDDALSVTKPTTILEVVRHDFTTSGCSSSDSSSWDSSHISGIYTALLSLVVESLSLFVEFFNQLPESSSESSTFWNVNPFLY